MLLPHLTSCCGKHLSQVAAARIQRDGDPCPLCKAHRWNTMLNKGVQRSINSLNVFCCYKDNKCVWRGKLTEVILHVLECSFSVRIDSMYSVFALHLCGWPMFSFVFGLVNAVIHNFIILYVYFLV